MILRGPQSAWSRIGAVVVIAGDRTNSQVRVIALASALSLMTCACSSAPLAGQNEVGSPSAPAVAASSPTAIATPTPAPKPTPIPSLPHTTVEATVAPPGAISIQMSAEGSPRFEPDQVTAEAGQVVFFLQSVPGVGFSVDHDMAIGPRIYMTLAGTPRVKPHASVVFTVEGMTPGTYAFWCQVPQHATNGMVGTLTITP